MENYMESPVSLSFWWSYISLQYTTYTVRSEKLVLQHLGPPKIPRAKKKQEHTLFNDLRQGIANKTQQGGLNTRWFMSHYDFRLGCDPPSATWWFKKIQSGPSPTMISDQNGVWPPFCNRVVHKIQGGSSPTMISKWGVTPLLQQGGS